MWGQIPNLQAKIKHRRTLQTCARCGFFFPKTETNCHHCYGMSDEDVLRSLARKKRFRLSLGKAMFLGALLILFIMYFI